MYPGKATKKDFEPKKAAVLDFKPLQGGNKFADAVLSPAVNILESATEYLIAIAVPGMSREDFKLEIEENVIAISAKHECVKGSVIDRIEYDFTDWTRKFALPPDADPLLAHAKYKDGELIIRIPRGNTIDNKTKVTIYVY
jgi:HSP20 family protein